VIRLLCSGATHPHASGPFSAIWSLLPAPAGNVVRGLWWARYWPYVRRTRAHAAAGALFTTVSAALESAGLAILGRAATQPFDAIAQAAIIAFAIAGCLVSSAMARAAAEWQLSRGQVSLESSLRESFADTILHCEWQDFVDHPGHQLQSAVLAEAPQVGQAATTLVRGLASSAAAIVVFSSTFLVSLPAAAVCTIYGIAIVYVYSRAVRGLQKVQTELADGNAEITRQTMILVNGLKALRLSPIQSHWRRDLQELFDRYSTARRSDLCIPVNGRLLVEVMTGLMIFSVLLIEVAHSGKILPGLIVMALILRVIPRVQTAQQLLTFARHGLTWVDRWQGRIAALNVAERRSGGRPPPRPHPAACGSSEVSGKDRPVLQIDGLEFSYRGHDVPVLTDVSLRLLPGEWISLRGPSGQGKSTLIDLIGGILLPTRGEISILGKPIREYSRQELYERLAIVPQDIHLVGATLEAVISWDGRMPPKFPIQTIMDALGVDSMFAFSDGRVESIDEMGRDMSGGMRTRLALARALASAPSVLILDETTSRLNPEAESEIVKAIRHLHPKLAVIVVTHRDETMAHMDRRLWLIDGRVQGG
jgi:ABC-type multidrug transport system fused ATPase/permease subunit